jgi:hypothetical protein
VAIKGKSRKRSKPKAAALPPRRAIGARKTPFAFRRDVKRVVVITLAVLSLLGGLRVWQNDSRSESLKKFYTLLNRAQAPFIPHFTADSPTSFDKNVQAFSAGQIGGGAMIGLATVWEKDFRDAEAKMAKLKAPNPVAKDAQELMQLGIDSYVGVVRLYNLAGQIRQLADAEKDPKQKKLLNDKSLVTAQQADELRKQRADEIYKRGATELNELLIRYGVLKRQTQQQQQSTTPTQ